MEEAVLSRAWLDGATAPVDAIMDTAWVMLSTS